MNVNGASAIIAAAVLFSAAMSLGQEDTERHDADRFLGSLIEQCSKIASSQRKSLESRLAGIKKQPGKGTFRTIHEKNQAISAIENKLRSPNGQLLEFPNLAFESLAVGDIGYLPDKEIIVFQVINEEAALVNVWRSTGLRIEKKLIWLETDTTGWTDGMEVNFPLPTSIVGTKKYTTRDGTSNTIFRATALTNEMLQSLRRDIPAGTTGIR